MPCAYVVSRFDFRFSKVIGLLIMSGVFINVNYIVVPIYTMVANIGKAFGIVGLTNNLVVVSLIYAITSVPFSVYLLSGYLVSFSNSYEEAAKIDGCSYFGILIKIVTPLSAPSVITVFLFSFLKFWNEYLIGITMISDKAKWTISIGLLNLMEVEKIANDYGRMYAGLVLAMIPTIIIYCLVQSHLTKGITMGGVKG